MPAITNITQLQSKLVKLVNRYRSDGTPSVVVGYTASYAVYVHEKPAKHVPGTQWKFLEQPARELGRELGSMISRSLSNGVKLLQALYLAGLRLQRASQQIAPVDTGNMRAGAFTAREDELESVASASIDRVTKRIKKQNQTSKSYKRARARHQKILRLRGIMWGKKK